MRKRAGLIGFVLVLLVFALAVPMQAAAPEADRMTQSLTRQGFPADVINRMPMDMKQEIVAKQLGYVKHVTRHSKFGESHSDRAPAPSSDVSIQSLDGFSESLTFARDYSAPSGVLRYYVYYDWDWYYQPMFTLTDKIGIAWGGSWAIDTNARPYRWSYTAYGRCCWPDRRESMTWTGTTADRTVPNAGVVYAIDIVNSFDKNGQSYAGIEHHQGWGRVIIRRPNPPTWGNNADNFVGQYFHAEYRCIPSISISYPASLGVASCTWTTDESPSVTDTLYY